MKRAEAKTGRGKEGKRSAHLEARALISRVTCCAISCQFAAHPALLAALLFTPVHRAVPRHASALCSDQLGHLPIASSPLALQLTTAPPRLLPLCRSSQVIGQSLGMPVPFAVTGWIGIVAAGATRVAYGTAMWQVSVISDNSSLTGSVSSVSLIMLMMRPQNLGHDFGSYTVKRLQGMLLCIWWQRSPISDHRLVIYRDRSPRTSNCRHLHGRC